MTARELYQAGKLGEAVQTLNGELRNNPTDRQRRTFLFELLCFAGDYSRAEKQLDLLAEGGNDAQMGVLVYRAALHAERTRNELFEKRQYPLGQAHAVAGTLNGKPFESLQDADPRIGARLELYAGGQYLWIPFEHIASIDVLPPKRLRDLLWAPALVKTGPGCKERDLGEVLLPVLSPFSFRHSDDAVKLGRFTEWEGEAGGEAVPVGQKMLLVDEEEFPILELRHVEFKTSEGTPDRHAAAQ